MSENEKREGVDLDARMAARFWAKVDVRGSAECWPWLASKLPRGYGCFRAGGFYLATHFALTAAGKPRPPGAFALHSCDNPECVNASHLRWGTHHENVSEMLSKGRQKSARRFERTPRGEKHGMSKLTAQEADIIRSSGMSLGKLAQQFAVSKRLISKIKRGGLWRPESVETANVGN